MARFLNPTWSDSSRQLWIVIRSGTTGAVLNTTCEAVLSCGAIRMTSDLLLDRFSFGMRLIFRAP